jgi:hypothetical protein
VKGGKLHKVEVKLWEGLLWIGRGWSGLPTVDREFAREEHGRRRRSAARGEMRMQERAKWREGKLVKVLDQKRREGVCTGASHDGGKVAAGQCSGRGGAAWRAREKAREEELGRRAAWGRRVGLPKAGGGAGRAAVAVSGSGLLHGRGGAEEEEGGGGTKG